MDALELNGWLWLTWSTTWFFAAIFSFRNRVSESRRARLGHSLPTVLGLYLIFFSRVYPVALSPAVKFSGVGVTALGLLFGVWARLHLGRYWSGVIALKDGHRLIRSGPYAWIRHPIYSGLLLAAIGSAVSSAALDAGLGLAVIILTYVFKARREEKVLLAKFGAEYARYIETTSRFVPF